MSSLRLRRLQADYDAVRRLAHVHPQIEVEGVSGRPPTKYRLTLLVDSLREQNGRIVRARSHRLEISLPQGYPRDAPLCRMLTPVFHPNIAPHAVCIGDHWSASESLDHLIQRVVEMLAFQSYNVKSPLDGRAARWVEEHLDELPIDTSECFIDLSGALPPESESGHKRCSNCEVQNRPVTACPAGHELCPDCISFCEECGHLLCLMCGAGSCPNCVGPPCANCATPSSQGDSCAGGHWLCDQCVARCETCGRTLCIVCGDYPCRICAPHGDVDP